MAKSGVLAQLRRFRRAQAGTIAVTFFLLLIPMIAAVGAAVDFLRAKHAHSALQSAVDAAALAAALGPEASTKDLNPLMSDYLNLNYSKLLGSGLTLKPPSYALNPANDSVIYSANATLDTILMRVAGYRSIDIQASAEALIQRGPLDLALVLDVTTSMNDPLGGQTKIDALKEAAMDLADIITPVKEAKIGIVPYLHEMNVGAHNEGKPWLKKEWADASGVETKEVKVCRWNPRPSGCRKVWSTVDGRPKEVEVCDVPGVLECRMEPRDFRGCIYGTRPEPYHASIADPVRSPYLAFLELTANQCGPPITELTDDDAAVYRAIDALYIPRNPVAQTYIPAGLQWGWHMLKEGQPLTGERTKAFIRDKNGQKAMVLMTDGVNSYAPTGPRTYTTIRNDISAYRTRGSDPTDPASYTNDLTAKLCRDIKGDGIKLYTVAFGVSDPKIKAILRVCASKPAWAFDASDPAELLRAFKEIAQSFQSTRLLK